ncbi:MAG: tRNA (N(6)-L-threonylcarbamoyladenosine(37)-C(2))-methylthiotransferase MtaB [Lachnospiraceae bacterium]|nr:tRNA (N(6)-L-threonylcarbamoyladenosine(37)-C(2))-methylthiotransferase MtaB [Lachnospiraceae bacterium]
MERMADKLISGGFTVVSFDEKADYYIVNTCSVTNIADRKSRQMLHRAKKINPGGVVVAVGCYVDTHGKEEVCLDDIDMALPNAEKDNIIEYLRAWEESHSKEEAEGSAETNGTNIRNSEDIHHISGEGIYTRKFLKVQDGCNMFCSYCIIPYARGRIRSRSIGDVISEIIALTEEGYREFVLTGIHLSSYGKDRPDENEDLLKLIKETDSLPGVKRIRLGSLEPRIVTDEFAEELSKIGSLCPHFHLSLQSGCDTVLKRMNRHYTVKEYEESVERLRKFFNDPAMTTDVIVGFPGETEKEFEETREFLNKISFYETHIFPYSRRKGTNADRMDGQLSRKVKHDRLEILKELDKKNREEYEERWIGREAEVLFEEENSGYTREYIRVKYLGDTVEPGTILKGRISGRDKEKILCFAGNDS